MNKTGIIFDIKEFGLHDGAGMRTTVFLKGCPLRCVWCHNPEGQKFEREITKNLNKCTDCGLCKKVCPKTENGICLSALSQKKGELQEDEAKLLQSHNIVWGCDICAEICPLNKMTEKTYIEKFINGYRNRFNVGEDIHGRAYEWRGEKTVTRNALLLEDKE